MTSCAYSPSIVYGPLWVWLQEMMMASGSMSIRRVVSSMIWSTRSLPQAYETVVQATRGIGEYFDLYNEERPHQALARLTPNEVYAGGFPLPKAA